jgi:hypothetical protein
MESTTDKLKVFLSYARHDASALADELSAGLAVAGFEPFLDRADIAAGEDWELRLSKLIAGADTVVFLLSPAGVQSERCAWEVATAERLSKRIIPVVAVPVAEEAVPVALRRLNYIFFSDSHSFARSLKHLVEALRVDLWWIREHTRLGELATRWQERGQPEALLLRGEELTAAQAWLGGRPSHAPRITDAHRSYVASSVDAEAARASKERQQLDEIARAQAAQAGALNERERAVKLLARRTMIGGIGAVGFSVVTGGLGCWALRMQREAASERERADRAQEQSVQAAIIKESARTDLEGQLIAYAASRGQLALDNVGAGENSPYTIVVLNELKDSQVSIQGALSRANRKVIDSTSSRQRPYLASDLNGDVYLRQPTTRQRQAIVVSVDSFDTARFRNAPRDGIAWERFLTETRFSVRRLENPTSQAVLQAVRELSFEPTASAQPPEYTRVGGKWIRNSPAIPNTCVFFYFAGQGFQIGDKQFLACRDTSVTKQDGEANVNADGVGVEELAQLLRERAAVSIMMLDTGFLQLDSRFQ